MSYEKVHHLRELIYRLGQIKKVPEDVHKDGSDETKCHHLRGRDMMFLKSIEDIGNGEPIVMNQLVQHFGITPAAISQIVRKLEHKGYIDRIQLESDRRSVYICLSEKAKQEIQAAESFIDAHLDELLDFLGEEDGTELIRLLEKVLEFNRKAEGVVDEKSI